MRCPGFLVVPGDGRFCSCPVGGVIMPRKETLLWRFHLVKYGVAWRRNFFYARNISAGQWFKSFFGCCGLPLCVARSALELMHCPLERWRPSSMIAGNAKLSETSRLQNWHGWIYLFALLHWSITSSSAPLLQILDYHASVTAGAGLPLSRKGFGIDYLGRERV